MDGEVTRLHQYLQYIAIHLIRYCLLPFEGVQSVGSTVF